MVKQQDCTPDEERRRYELAMAAGKDAANRAMKSGGRTRWSTEDYNVMVRTVDSILGPMPLPCE